MNTQFEHVTKMNFGHLDRTGLGYCHAIANIRNFAAFAQLKIAYLKPKRKMFISVCFFRMDPCKRLISLCINNEDLGA